MGNSQQLRTSLNDQHSIKPPKQFLTKKEFFDTWYTWKENFLTFKQSFPKDKYDDKQWGNMLLNIIGPVGHDIYNRFLFSCPNEKDNIDILLQKFDEYFIFLKRKKMPEESIYAYISDLMLTIREKKIKNGEELIKQKILTEIDENQFNNSIYYLIPTFKLSNDFNKLTLKEIGFIWTSYTNTAKSCMRCGNIHDSNTCPSKGKQCVKCNNWNHFPKRCPKIFVFNCKYCGGAHKNKKCPAFNETCTKCKHLHHFSWKCQFQHILRCRFCGLSHAASKAVCPAKYTFCFKCKTTGHFALMCNKKP